MLGGQKLEQRSWRRCEALPCHLCPTTAQLCGFCGLQAQSSACWGHRRLFGLEEQIPASVPLSAVSSPIHPKACPHEGLRRSPPTSQSDLTPSERQPWLRRMCCVTLSRVLALSGPHFPTLHRWPQALRPIRPCGQQQRVGDCGSPLAAPPSHHGSSPVCSWGGGGAAPWGLAWMR